MIRKQQAEAGRSLIEMLATLAIMGVLSIGSIAGFNYAMNKYRANELLDEARKRAYTIMTQIQLGLPRSLGEYSRYNTFAGGTFSSDVQMVNNRFSLTVHDVLPTVCRRLKESVGTGTLVRKVVCSSLSQGNAVLFFNTDGATIDPPGQLCDKAQGVYCQYGQLCSTSGEVAGTCLDKDDSWECLTNEDCADKPNTFCSFLTTRHNISGSVCLDVGNSSGEINVDGFGVLEMSRQGDLNYWSAKNWCAAKGKDLIDISGTRLECYQGDTLVVLDTRDKVGKITDFDCCKKGYISCKEREKQSPKILKLRDSFSSLPAFWTKTDANLWMGFRVAGIAISGDTWREGAYYSALCE